MNNLLEQIKYCEQNIPNYGEDPYYLELLKKYSDSSKLSYYENEMLKNLNGISNVLVSICIELKEIKNKK
jgi:hypothetical protein